MPLNKNYTALHRSVLECAIVGCTSIWVIAEKKHIPLLKAVVGTFVEDPYVDSLPIEFKEQFRMRIPIFYSPIPFKDLSKRDCYGRTILMGAFYASQIAGRLSNSVVPDKFYVSFPQSAFPIWKLAKQRKIIKSTNINFYLSSEGKTIKDGSEYSFTFFQNDLKRFLKDFREQDSGASVGESGTGKLYTLRKLPASERYSARFLGLDEVFRTAIMDGATIEDCGPNYNISTWEGYTEYIKNSYLYHMPKKVRYFKYNKIKELESRIIESEGSEDASEQIKS